VGNDDSGPHSPPSANHAHDLGTTGLHHTHQLVPLVLDIRVAAHKVLLLEQNPGDNRTDPS
jgi:hypothetical protein